MRCHFGEETPIAATRGGQFHGVRLLPGASVWSASEGLFVRPAGSAGERLGPACTGGLDAISAGGVHFVACATRAQLAGDKLGGTSLWRLEGERRHRAELPGAVGEEGAGVALALHDGVLELVWHAGEVGAFHVWHRRFDPRSLAPRGEPQRLSNPRVAAGSPTLSVHGDRLAITWAEHWAQAGARDRVAGHVVVSVDGAAPRVLVEVEHHSPHPVIGRDERGPVLLFRDHREPLEHPSLFAHRLSSDLRPHGGLELIGRADMGGAIRRFGCTLGGAPTQAVVVGRSWGKEDALVSLHLLDEDLGGRELQVYEFGGQLTLGDGRCTDGRIELLIGERSVPSGPPASLFSLPVACAAPD